MSLKGGDYKGFVVATGKKVISIESAISTLQSDVVDGSGVVAEFKQEFQDLSAQVQVLDASMVVVETSLEDLSGSVARVNASNTFTEDNFFTGFKQFVVNIPSAEGTAISFAGREVNVQGVRGLECYAGPETHIPLSVSGAVNVNQSVFGGVDDRSVNFIKTPKIEITTEPVDISDGVTKGYVDESISAVETRLDGMGVGNVINAFPLSRAIFLLNEEYVVEGVGKVDWALTLSAGTYMFVFTPNAYITNSDGDAIIWTSENCNCNYIEYRLGFVGLLRFSVYPDLSVPVGNVGQYKKYFGKYTMVFTLEEETTLNLFTTFSSPEVGQPVLDPVYGYTESSIEYVKLS
jgi:hypothetical protein